MGKTYSEGKLIHILLDNFHQSGKYTAQIASHQVDLKRKGKFTDQKYLSVLYLQNYYINIDSGSGSVRNDERANLAQTKCTLCEGANNYSEIN